MPLAVSVSALCRLFLHAPVRSMPALDARSGRRLAPLRSEVRHPDLERKVGRAAREEGLVRVEVRRVDPVRVALEPLHELSGAGRPLTRVRGA